jgi:hypothetical protein
MKSSCCTLIVLQGTVHRRQPIMYITLQVYILVLTGISKTIATLSSPPELNSLLRSNSPPADIQT